MSFFDRLVSNGFPYVMLKTSHHAHADIMNFPNQYTYNMRMKNAAHTKSLTLDEVWVIGPSRRPGIPLRQRSPIGCVKERSWYKNQVQPRGLAADQKQLCSSLYTVSFLLFSLILFHFHFLFPFHFLLLPLSFSFSFFPSSPLPQQILAPMNLLLNGKCSHLTVWCQTASHR